MSDNPPYWPDEVEIVLRKWDDAATVNDPEFDEPVGDARFESRPYKLCALVDTTNRSFERLFMARGGDAPQSSIRLILRERDLEDLNLVVDKKDRVEKIAGKKVKLQVTESRPESALEGEFLLRVLECEEVSQEQVTI